MSVQRFFERLCGVSSEPEYLTALPAAVSDDFPLRRSQEEKLYRALCRRGRQILLYAPGGMGKTHMARKLFYRLRDKYKRMAWITYGSGIRESMTMPQTNQASENPDVRFADFIHALEEEPNTILFIDDAKETAVDDLVLAQLTGLGITILLTSRCPRIAPYESWALEPITNRECADLFYANYSQDPEQKYRDAVAELAERMERNVFAIRLLASVAGEPRRLPQLAKAMDQGNLMDHIGQLMDFSNLNQKQRRILRCLSLMPESVMLESLVAWFDFPQADLELLVEKGWLIRDREAETLVLHDLVREYCNREKPDKKTMQTFLDGAMGENSSRGAAEYEPPDFKGKVLKMFIRAVAFMEQHWDSQEDLAHAYNNLALEFQELGNYRNALEYQLKALDIWEKSHSEECLNLAISYNNVGMAYQDLGEFAKALEYLNRGLEIAKIVYADDLSNLATFYNNLGMAYLGLGKCQKALKYFMISLEQCEKTLSADHPDLAASYNNVGLAYMDLGEHEKALEYLMKDLEICKRVLPADHPDLATSYNNVGLMYLDLGKSEQALEYLTKDLEICEKVLPADHPNMATSYDHMGRAYMDLGNPEKAEGYLMKALNIRESVLPSDHPDMAVSYSNISRCYTEDKRYKEALKWMQRALEIAEYSLPEEHPNRKAYQEAVEDLKGKIS